MQHPHHRLSPPTGPHPHPDPVRARHTRSCESEPDQPYRWPGPEAIARGAPGTDAGGPGTPDDLLPRHAGRVSLPRSRDSARSPRPRPEAAHYRPGAIHVSRGLRPGRIEVDVEGEEEDRPRIAGPHPRIHRLGPPPSRARRREPPRAPEEPRVRAGSRKNRDRPSAATMKNAAAGPPAHPAHDHAAARGAG